MTMLRIPCFALVLVACLPFPARADEFAIDLTVLAGSEKVTVHAQVLEAGAKAQPRRVLHVKAGERIQVKWTLSNIHSKDSFKDVLVHFFAAREDIVGQKAVPKLGKDVAAETALTVDFAPGDRTQGELSFSIERAGPYLLRLETLGAAAGLRGHEYYAALDLVVQ
jgi:hypothetical protein